MGYLVVRRSADGLCATGGGRALTYREAQHFGATLDWGDWRSLAERLTEAEAPFRMAPTINEACGQAKMMLMDPDGYLVEIKAYLDPSLLARPT